MSSPTEQFDQSAYLQAARDLNQYPSSNLNENAASIVPQPEFWANITQELKEQAHHIEKGRQLAETLLENHKEEKTGVTANLKLEAKQERLNHNRLVIPESCRGHLLIRMGIEMARVTEMPEASCVLIGLGLFSGIASAAYCTSYRDGSRLPLGLYTVAEQPPGTGKSRLIDKFVSPWKKHVADINIVRPVPDDEAPRNQLLFPLSDTTPEGLENNMQKADSGHFFIQSAEQGAIKLLFGDKLDGRSKNFDVPLKGFNGEFHASARVTRMGIAQDVFGTITVFAQGGSIRTILNNTDGEGLAERFLYVSEPSNLGHRTHNEHTLPADIEEKYLRAVQGVADVCKTLEKLGNKDALQCLTLNPQAHERIRQMKIRFEPKQAMYNRQGVAVMNSIVAKADMQVMKLATLLHVAFYLSEGQPPNDEVSEQCVVAAIELVEALLDHIEQVMIGEDEAGTDLAHSAIRRWLSKHHKGAILRVIQDNLKRTKPFMSMEQPRTAISQAIEEMISTGDIKQEGNRFKLP